MTWPRSLLARNAALLAALVVVGQLISLFGYFFLVQMPRAAQLAETTQRYAMVLETTLAKLPPPARDAVLALDGSPVQRRANPPPVTGPSRALAALLIHRFERALAARLDGRRIGIVRGGEDMLWIELRVPGDRLWFVTGTSRIIADNVTNWVIVSTIGAIIGILGALLIQRRINKPLAALGEAAQRLGAGTPGPPVPEEGPTELAALSRQFNRMVADLAAVDRNRALMLAGISHDVRTPLTRVRLATELLEGQAEAELLQRIRANLGEVDHILGQFLAFARDEAAEAPEFRDVNALVAGRVAAQEQPADQLRFEAGDVPDLSLRPLAIARAVDNLIGNALKHGAAPVIVSTRFEQGKVVIAVADKGKGVDPAEIDRLRRPFERGEAGGASTGLGLAIVDRIARLHGGALAFRNGAGFVAQLELPV